MDYALHDWQSSSHRGNQPARYPSPHLFRGGGIPRSFVELYKVKIMVQNILIGGLLLGLLATGKYAFDLKQNRNNLVQENIQYLEKNPSRIGYLVGYGNYNLKSFDSGKTWYMFNNDWTKILGEAEKVKPGLVQSLGAWDAIAARAKSGNPVSLDSEDDVKLIQNAGITVNREEKQ